MHLIVWARRTKLLFSKHARRLFWVCFFPTGLLVLHPAGRPRQCIATHVDGQPAERRQTRTQVLLPLIWDQQRPSCSGFAIKANKPQRGRFYPSANQRASSSPMPKLIRWRRLNSFVSQIEIAVVHQRVNTLIPVWACEKIQNSSFERDRQPFQLSHQSHPRWWWWWGLMMTPSFITCNPNTCMPGSWRQ